MTWKLFIVFYFSSLFIAVQLADSKCFHYPKYPSQTVKMKTTCNDACCMQSTNKTTNACCNTTKICCHYTLGTTTKKVSTVYIVSYEAPPQSSLSIRRYAWLGFLVFGGFCFIAMFYSMCCSGSSSDDKDAVAILNGENVSVHDATKTEETNLNEKAKEINENQQQQQQKDIDHQHGPDPHHVTNSGLQPQPVTHVPENNNLTLPTYDQIFNEKHENNHHLKY